MDVVFITTSSDKLDTVPVVNGQIIALDDTDAYLYDMGGVRRVASHNTTYAFAEGSANGAFSVTPSIDGTPGQPQSIPIHGLGSLAYRSSLTKSDVGLSNVGNFKAVSTEANQGLTTTEKSNARANIGAGTSSFSGSYNDLSNKPTIPTVPNGFSRVTVGSTNIDADTPTDTLTLVAGSNITLTPDATNDKVTIAASKSIVNNGTLTIQKNGTNVQTFTANQSSNATANITVPTKVSELTNDSGYTKNTGTVTQVKVGSTAYNPSSGVVSLPAYPTSLPASDVYSWAKASTKPTYAASEVTFNNTGTSMTATNVQAAIAELEAGGSGSDDSKMDKNNPTGTGSFSLNRKTDTIIGPYSFAEGYNATAMGGYSHAEGGYTTASGSYSHAEGASTTASGSSSHSEGGSTTASGQCSHAEGGATTAGARYSHAEGNSTTANAEDAHAEGLGCTASGLVSHAEGGYTTASGSYSHAQGRYTTAQRKSQHVFGEYNVLDTTGDTTTKGDYVEIVGNGTGTSARSNARTLDWNGNEVLAGSLTTTDVVRDAKWDGTNTSLATAISSLNSTLGIMLSRTRNDITSRLSNLSTAVSEQNLAKYGYKIGDYFKGASGYTYTLADYNTFKGTSTPYCLTQNHLCIVVNTHKTSQWHSGNASSVGYNGSVLHIFLKGTAMNNIKSDFKTLFGGSTGLEHLLPHSKLLTTAFASWAWQANQYISALTCTQIDAGSQWTANGYQEGEVNKSLELFRKYKWTEIFGSEYPWLRNLSNYSTGGSYACYAANSGVLSGDNIVTTKYFAVGLINFY